MYVIHLVLRWILPETGIAILFLCICFCIQYFEAVHTVALTCVPIITASQLCGAVPPPPIFDRGRLLESPLAGPSRQAGAVGQEVGQYCHAACFPFPQPSLPLEGSVPPLLGKEGLQRQ